MAAYSNLIQSKYYSRVFNSAVFDGIVRIYFAQASEAQALRLYFLLQQKLEKELLLARELSKRTHKNIFILNYPDSASLLETLKSPPDSGPIHFDQWEDKGFVYYFAGELSDMEVDLLVDLLRGLVEEWQKQVDSEALAFQQTLHA